MIPSDAPPGYNTPGCAHPPIPLTGDQCPEKHPKSADQADEQPIPPVMRRLVGRNSSTVLILDIPHRFDSPYQKSLCCGASPYSNQAKASFCINHEGTRAWGMGAASALTLPSLQNSLPIRTILLFV
jgi:hypothetical protein